MENKPLDRYTIEVILITLSQASQLLGLKRDGQVVVCLFSVHHMYHKVPPRECVYIWVQCCLVY